MSETVVEKLNEILGLEVGENQELVPHELAEIVSSGNIEKDMEDDLGVARRTLYTLIEKGNELVDNANFFAKEKQDARSVEAASMAQKETRETAMALVNLHKTRKEIDRMSTSLPTGGDMNVTQNAVFVGTTGELLKSIKSLNTEGALNGVLKALNDLPQPTTINIEKEDNTKSA